MAFGGTFLKLVETILYALEFCCASIILGVYSYFMSVLADRDVYIRKTWQAVEGISGLAVLYTILAVLLTCCLGGKSFFALLGIVLDLLFMGAFVAVAVLTREGARSCSGNVRTPLGNGPSNSKQGFGSSSNGNGPSQITYSVSLGTACRLNSAVFAVAIAGAVLFLLSAIVQVLLARHHRKEKRYGPSPANNYTRGSGVKFWQRGKKNRGTRDAEMAGTVPATGGLSGGHHDVRPSHDTAYTGSTVANNSAYEHGHNKTLSGGYHTAPTGTYAAPTSNTYAPPTEFGTWLIRVFSP
ncbi:hypothetical protein GQ43DRAFT_446179 [Delitschia confertaspora ATCC 74209]|uniref:MARVEL domain-containing protein n=1 Tax=Delitschia confertaspora ATCC 74209 TaxID=1513339 RepID=A0A9P4JVN2_9PLEO|nr:hypothetical protein GQ43DRAFT_446179 [Delitschia confertaspora ATCC 74209]